MVTQSAPSLLLRSAGLHGSEAQWDIEIGAGRILRIAPHSRIRTADVRGETVELDGRLVLPGLWDSHVHSRQWALQRSSLDLT
ncbi:MAG: amidohydrolase, partial [Microbacterium sp.]